MNDKSTQTYLLPLESKKKTKKRKRCSGCYPNFQPNQLAHMELGGCLYEDIFLHIS